MNRIDSNTITMPEEEYIELTDENMGICRECGETQSGVEPDAEEYTCEACGEQAVYGAEQLLLMGVISFE